MIFPKLIFASYSTFPSIITEADLYEGFVLTIPDLISSLQSCFISHILTLFLTSDVIVISLFLLLCSSSDATQLIFGLSELLGHPGTINGSK